MFVVLNDFIDNSFKYGGGYNYIRDVDDIYLRILYTDDYEMEVITQKEFLSYIPKFSKNKFYNIEFDPIVRKYYVTRTIIRPKSFADEKGILRLNSDCKLYISSPRRIGLTFKDKEYSFSYLNYSSGFILYDRLGNFSMELKSLRDSGTNLSDLNHCVADEIDCSSIYFYNEHYLVLNMATTYLYNIMSIIFRRETGELLYAKSFYGDVILTGVNAKINLLGGLEWH